MKEIYSVYIKTNKNKDITFITSSLVSDQGDKIKIDEGIGTKYSHAQQNYLSKPIQNLDGSYNYKYIDNHIVINTELEPQVVPPTKNQQEFNMEVMLEIAKIKAKLGVE